MISLSVVDPVITEGGWAFRDGFADAVNGFALLREAYLRAKPDYSGRVTVPVLWDKRTGRIVNNESAEIIIKRHYFMSHRHLNPSGLVPKGPTLDFTLPHDRARFAVRTARRIA